MDKGTLPRVLAQGTLHVMLRVLCEGFYLWKAVAWRLGVCVYVAAGRI